MNTRPSRYHAGVVALHWLLAGLIVLALAMGTLSLEPLPNSSPDKIGALRAHMIVGVVIGGLMLLRLLARVRTAAPLPASTNRPGLDKMGRAAHIGLYLAVFAMAASGAATAWQAGLPGIVFGGGAGPLPETFSGLVPRAVHGAVAKLLMALVALHVMGALFHQVGLKDRLMSRMWFGRP